MAFSIEVDSRQGWMALEAPTPPKVGESDLFRLRGLPPHTPVDVGGAFTVNAGADGTAEVAWRNVEAVRGHIGLVEIRTPHGVVGEIEVVPDKMSEAAYRALRGDLEGIWSGLVLDPTGVSRLEAGLPPPEELWRRIEAPVRQILEAPRDHLIDGEVLCRANQVRRRTELSPSVLRGAARGAPGLARSVIRTTDIAENHMVADTLARLHAYAARVPDGAEVASRTVTLLRRPPFRRSGRAHAQGRHFGPTWGMRSDQRYRRVLAVHRLLCRPELEPTEGPGELRLGVKGMSRLYEYWVFLQILVMATARYGPPLGPGFSALAVPLDRGRSRLELMAGTTISFPGEVHVAFEPAITASGNGWMGVEYVPHHDPARFQSLATPDVVVYREGPTPWITVIDAKYVGRRWVEPAASDIHSKYARMRVKGRPAVRHVIAAHPHAGFSNLWAGYGHIPMVPGTPLPQLPLLPPPPASPPLTATNSAGPEPVRPAPPTTTAERPLPSRGPAPIRSQIASGPPIALGSGEGPVTIVADQWWMHHHLGPIRIDLGDLVDLARQGRMLSEATIVMPLLPVLQGFQRAAEHLGWSVEGLSSANRATSVAALTDLVARHAAATVVLVSGDPQAIDAARHASQDAAGHLEVIRDLADLPSR